MAEWSLWRTRGAEISERSEELILPDRHDRGDRIGDDPQEPTADDDRAQSGARDISARSAARAGDDATAPIDTEPAATADADTARIASPESGLPDTYASVNGPASLVRPVGWRAAPLGEVAAIDAPSGRTHAHEEALPAAPMDRGVALPGDRDPHGESHREQRPSFWRRIAMGRRASADHGEPAAEEPGAMRMIATRLAAPVTGSASPTLPTEAVAKEVEKRVVEPMLQALVSVESKLERSHVDLIGRSDLIEQRLTQLWDIEEQLGALGELQESLQRVSEQQRRLESAIRSQTRTLRWVVAALAVTLAAAAFVVAAFSQ